MIAQNIGRGCEDGAPDWHIDQQPHVAFVRISGKIGKTTSVGRNLDFCSRQLVSTVRRYQISKTRMLYLCSRTANYPTKVNHGPPTATPAALSWKRRARSLPRASFTKGRHAASPSWDETPLMRRAEPTAKIQNVKLPAPKRA